jgi:hypothetical protein
MNAMKSMPSAAFAMVWFAAAACAAEPAPPVTADAPATAPAQQLPREESAQAKTAEPAVKRTVIDERLAHIEELRVRGQVQKITVDPKGRAPGYEVLPGDGSSDIADGANTSHGPAGKRVWNVLRF